MQHRWLSKSACLNSAESSPNRIARKSWPFSREGVAAWPRALSRQPLRGNVYPRCREGPFSESRPSQLAWAKNALGTSSSSIRGFSPLRRTFSLACLLWAAAVKGRSPSSTVRPLNPRRPPHSNFLEVFKKQVELFAFFVFKLPHDIAGIPWNNLQSGAHDRLWIIEPVFC